MSTDDSFKKEPESLGNQLAENLNRNVMRQFARDRASAARGDTVYDSEWTPPTGMALILDAAVFAAYKHREGTRKDEEESPYINHPLEVARTLAIEGGVQDDIILAAAILHDTIEDTKTEERELRARFGREVASIVVEVTDDETLPKAERKRLQIEHAHSLSPRAKLVKLADKIANVRDVLYRPPADWSAERREEYVEWARRVVEQLHGVNEGLKTVFAEACKHRPTE
jgi:guanosine-3',5'-bis(diphosphate) 3'-pyrophosphohydrolase